MPLSTRDTHKRTIQQAISNIETAQVYLLNLSKVYEIHHPDIAKNFEKVCAALQVTIPVLDKQRDAI